MKHRQKKSDVVPSWAVLTSVIGLLVLMSVWWAAVYPRIITLPSLP